MIDLMTAHSGAWGWIIVGLLLAAAETQAPGAFLIWIGLASMTTGIIVMVMPLSTTGTIIAFAILVLAFGFLGKLLYGSRSKIAGSPGLNRRVEGLVGREFLLDQAIENGIGRIRVDDSVWRVSGPDLPAGARVKVTGTGRGTVLAVEPLRTT